MTLSRTIKKTLKLVSLAAVASTTAGLAHAKPWIMRHGLTEPMYQDFYDNELPANYRPLSVNVNGGVGTERFAAIWIDDPKPWIAHHDMTSDDYDTLANLYAGDSYRLIAVDAYGVFPNERYAAIWVDDNVSNADWGAVHRRTAGQFQDEIDDFEANGFDLVWMSGHGAGADRLFAGIFVRSNDGYSWDYSFDLTEAEYQQDVEDHAIAGYRVHGMTGYGTAGNPQLGAIYFRPDGPNWEVQSKWEARHNQIGVEHEDLAVALHPTLFQPTCAIEYGSTGNPEFGSCYFEDTPAPVFTETGTFVPELSLFDDAMEDFMTSRKFQRGALAVTKDGRLVLNRAYTYDHAGVTPTSPANRFRVASVSKPITAVAVMKAIDLGLFDLETTIGELPNFPITGWTNGNEVPNEVTIEMLLQHRGGWDRNQTQDPMFNNNTVSNTLDIDLPITLLDIVNYQKDIPLDFNPGDDYQYSNFGYALLGAAIEATSGQYYEDFVRQHVLCEIGAANMTLGRSLKEHKKADEVNYRDPMNRFNYSVMSEDRPLVQKPYGEFNIENMAAHGGWLSTAAELARFVSDFTTMTTSDLLTFDQVDFVFNENPETNSYGSGFQRSGSMIFHNGSLRGSWSFIIRRPDGVTISVMFNGRSNGVNTPVADDDWDIYNDLNNVATIIENSAGGLAWPTHNFFGIGTQCAPDGCGTDFDRDGATGSSDLAELIGNWGSRGPSDHDLDGDGIVGAGDLANLLGNWGPCP